MMKSRSLHGFLATAALSLVDPAAAADFIRPEKPGDPLIYGVKKGICVAVHASGLGSGRPQGGPRGLIRVGYEEKGRYYLINFIAIEPIVGPARGFSELEPGGDGLPGKRLSVSDRKRDGGVGANGIVRGSIEQTPEGGVLSFFIHVEPFANGARPVIEISLFEKVFRAARRLYPGSGDLVRVHRSEPGQGVRIRPNERFSSNDIHMRADAH